LLILTIPVLLFPSSIAASNVAINTINLEDESETESLRERVDRELARQNLNVLGPGQDVDFDINIYQSGAEYDRSFNWLILILPLWPIVGITQSTTTVYVDSEALDQEGNRVWSGSGKAEDSTIFFSDFRHPSQAPLLTQAAQRSVSGAGYLASFEAPNNKITLVSLPF